MAARAGGNMEVEITATTLAPAAAIASSSAAAGLARLWAASPVGACRRARVCVPGYGGHGEYAGS